MAKFSGKIGYIKTVEKEIEGRRTGEYDEQITEKTYFGEVIQNISRWENSNNLNDNISINNSISIVADPFAHENFQHIRYVEWNKQKWKVLNIRVEYPRLILTLGGIYNGPESEE